MAQVCEAVHRSRLYVGKYSRQIEDLSIRERNGQGIAAHVVSGESTAFPMADARQGFGRLLPAPWACLNTYRITPRRKLYGHAISTRWRYLRRSLPPHHGQVLGCRREKRFAFN